MTSDSKTSTAVILRSRFLHRWNPHGNRPRTGVGRIRGLGATPPHGSCKTGPRTTQETHQGRLAGARFHRPHTTSSASGRRVASTRVLYRPGSGADAPGQAAVNREPDPVGTLVLFSSRLLTLSPHSLFQASEPLCASLPGSLAASVALGSARLDFEATPVVDADHGVSESRSRRRRGRCCGLWE